MTASKYVTTKHPGISRWVDKGGNESFQVRWYAKGGKRKSGTRDTLREALALQDEMKGARRAGRSADPSGQRTLYGAYTDAWWPTRGVQGSTFDTEGSYLRNRILPEWGDVRLGDITPTDVRGWISDMFNDELAPATVRKIYGLFRQSVTLAFKEGLIPVNPTATIPLPKVPTVEAQFMTVEEAIRIDEAMDPWWGITVPVMAECGARIGEVAALLVRDVDTAAGSVRVRETATREDGGKRVQKEPKSYAGTRTVPTLTEATCARIDALVAERGLEPDDHLFTGERGGVMSPGNYRNRVWHPALLKAGIEGRPTPHALRHTAVSMWIASGMKDPLVITRWAGHSSITVTYDRYGHLFPEDADDLRGVLGDIWSAARSLVADGREAGSGPDK